MKNLTYLTDGIAKALSRTSGELNFENLKTIDGRHAEMLLNGPTKEFRFWNPTVLTEDFLAVMENCQKQTRLYVRRTPIDVAHFERLMTNENVHLLYALHLLTEAHIQKLLELGEKNVGNVFRCDEYLQGDIDVALRFPLEFNDWFIIVPCWHGQTLQADSLRGIEKLSRLLVFRMFKNVDLDLLPILKERSDNGFPTLFVNCTMPNGEFRERLEGFDIYFVTENKGQHGQLQPFMDKWLEDKKKLTE